MSHYASRGQRTQFIMEPEAAPKKATETYLPDRRIVSSLGWTTLVLSLLATLVTMVTFFTPGWMWVRERGKDVWKGDSYVYYSLWYSCSRLISGQGGYYCVIMATLPNIPAWFKAAQAMGVFGLLFGVGTFILCAVYIFYKKFNRRPGVAGTIAILAILTAIIHVFEFVLFAVQYMRGARPQQGQDILEYHLHYSFGLCVVAALLHLVSGITASVELHHLRQ